MNTVHYIETGEWLKEVDLAIDLKHWCVKTNSGFVGIFSSKKQELIWPTLETRRGLGSNENSMSDHLFVVVPQTISSAHGILFWIQSNSLSKVGCCICFFGLSHIPEQLLKQRGRKLVLLLKWTTELLWSCAPGQLVFQQEQFVGGKMGCLTSNHFSQPSCYWKDDHVGME